MTYTFRTFIVPAAVVDMARAMCVELAAQAGITVTVEQVAGLLAAVDVSEQAPFAAMERLGLQMVRGVLP